MELEQELMKKILTLNLLKSGVNDATKTLINLLDSKKDSLKINDKEEENISNLLIYNSLIKDEVNYSYLNDFDFNNKTIFILNKNRLQAKNNVIFMNDYLFYRISNPVDLGSC